MKEKNDEIEESQLGEAQTADNCASPYDLNELSTNIGDIRKLVTNFCKDPIEGEKTREMFLGSLLGMLDEAIGQLNFYIEDLKQNKCIEPFKVSSERNDNDDEDFWKYIDMLFDEIKHDEAYQRLKNNVSRFRLLLAEVETAMQNCDPIVFEKFFFRVKPGDVEEGVVKQFHRKIYEKQPITNKKLRVMQAEAVIKALGQGIFDFADKPSKQEVNKVKPELNTDLVPCNFEITEDFKEAYAIFRQYTDKKGIMLVLDYVRYGKYIVDHKKQFSDDHFKAIFELDVMLHLIHAEMVNLDSELAQYLKKDNETNTFGIVNSLTRLMQQDWFKEYRTDKKYDNGWIEKFVSELLASNHRLELLNIWQDG